MPPPRDIPPGDLLDGFDIASTPAARTSVLGILWRWRYEVGSLLILAASAVGLYLTTGTSGLVMAAVIAGAGVTAAMWWPPSHKRIVARVMCVVVQHRVRTACAAAWVQTRSGKLPVILWTVPRPFGESMLLWCRAGITPDDLVRAREILRGACWASDVRVIPDGRRPHRVRLDIIRIPCAYDVTTEEWPRPVADDTDPEPHDPSTVPLSARHNPAA
jgi:hypothetical protein